MLDELSPEKFDEWLAYRSIEPDPWERLIAIVKHGFAALCNAQGATMEPDDLDRLMPEQKPDIASPEQAAQMVSQVLGQGQRSV